MFIWTIRYTTRPITSIIYHKQQAASREHRQRHMKRKRRAVYTATATTPGTDSSRS
jgi:hypothetical protein